MQKNTTYPNKTFSMQQITKLSRTNMSSNYVFPLYTKSQKRVCNVNK